jgi:uncharacterized protein (DUF697 family)
MATQKRKTIALNPLRDIHSKGKLAHKPLKDSLVKVPKSASSLKKVTAVTKGVPASGVNAKLDKPAVKRSKPVSKSVNQATTEPLVKPTLASLVKGSKAPPKTQSSVTNPDAVAGAMAEEKLSAVKKGAAPEGANEIFEAELSLISSPTRDALFSDGGSYAVGKKTVLKWSKISLATIVLPNSLLEYAAISGIQLKMLHDLSRIYDIPFKADGVKVIIGSILGGSVAYFLSDLYSNWVKVIPVVGKPIAFLSEPAMAYLTTYAVGFVFLEHFENNGSFQDIELEQIKKSIKLKISEKYKELVKGNKLTGTKRFFSFKNVSA